METLAPELVDYPRKIYYVNYSSYIALPQIIAKIVPKKVNVQVLKVDKKGKQAIIRITWENSG